MDDARKQPVHSVQCKGGREGGDCNGVGGLPTINTWHMALLQAGCMLTCMLGWVHDSNRGPLLLVHGHTEPASVGGANLAVVHHTLQGRQGQIADKETQC